MNCSLTSLRSWEDFRDWAHHVRDTGNAGAHGERFDPVTIEQSKELETFIGEMINFLYPQPARRAAALTPTKPSSQTAPSSGPTDTPHRCSHIGVSRTTTIIGWH